MTIYQDTLLEYLRLCDDLWTGLRAYSTNTVNSTLHSAVYNKVQY